MCAATFRFAKSQSFGKLIAHANTYSSFKPGPQQTAQKRSRERTRAALAVTLAAENPMASAKLLKSWKVTETLLERARHALPESIHEVDEEYRRVMAHYSDMLAHNELGLAFEALEEIGHLVKPRGGFWRDVLLRAAENMGLADAIPRLQAKYKEALTHDGQ